MASRVSGEGDGRGWRTRPARDRSRPSCRFSTISRHTGPSASRRNRTLVSGVGYGEPVDAEVPCVRLRPGGRQRGLGRGAVIAAVVVVLVASGAAAGTRASTASCVVSTRGSSTKPPARFIATGMPVPYVHTWFGSKAIWIRLPRQGVLPAQRDPGGRTISAKFPWWRVLSGQLHAWSQPLGRVGARISADVGTVQAYGPSGFVPSTLRFSRAGCWRVTGSVGGHSLSFVTRVVTVKQ
jgi:hypothetical protein